MFFNNFFLGCILLTLFGCGSSDIKASPESDKSSRANEKIFELNLVDKQISDQGGVAKIFKNTHSCKLSVELFSSYGKETYDFNFKSSKLKTTNHSTYKYVNGIVSYGTEDDKELQELMAEPKEKTTELNEMELIKEEKVVGNKNKKIAEEFQYYLSQFPTDVILKCE
ncbi:hypothetical protein [Acinetobacter sp. WZC-1]|uniref:hypothetical protein n=1 Tax=Acinetobacter sp. WZC-1 TaxID=3459034 RepID=UPI00403DD09D